MSTKDTSKKQAKEYYTTIFINKDPDRLWKGWGWIDMYASKIEKYKIDKYHPRPRTINIEEITDNEDKAYILKNISKKNIRISRDNTFTVKAPGRGRSGGKKFTIQIENESIPIKAQKSLNINAIVAWVKTWAGEKAQIITPGNKTLSTNGEIESSETEFIYFILNEECNAVKIGRAKDVDKRLKSLQTANCCELKIIKTIRTNGNSKAKKFEEDLHEKYKHLRIRGEWFKAEQELLNFKE